VTINYTVKPAEPYKKTIPPSSLYKGRCARCTWMNFWHNFKIPVNMNLQQNLSRKQEKFFDGCPTTTLDASLRPGKITLMKGKKRSSLITINGQQTRWAFYGELDFGVNYDDGGFGVADGKVSLKDDPEDLTQYFHVIESQEKVTLFNEQFLVWIVPKTEQDVPVTYVLIAINAQNKTSLEVVFTTSGVYNTPKYVLKVLQFYLLDMLETEATLTAMEKNQ